MSRYRIDIAAIYKKHTPLAVLIFDGSVEAWVPFQLVVIRDRNNRPVKILEEGMDIIVNMPESVARERKFI